MDREVVEGALSARASRLPPGWRLYLEPSDDKLPPELRGYELDAVAIGPTGGIVFEVVEGRRALGSGALQSKLDRLRASTKRLADWSVELVLTPAPPPPLVDANDILGYRTAAVSIKEEQPSAAFLLAFTVLEWTLAMMAAEAGVEYEPNAQRLAGSLAPLGYIREDEFTKVRDFQHRRNLLVHARQGGEATATEVEEVLHLAEKIGAKSTEIADT